MWADSLKQLSGFEFLGQINFVPLFRGSCGHECGGDFCSSFALKQRCDGSNSVTSLQLHSEIEVPVA